LQFDQKFTVINNPDPATVSKVHMFFYIKKIGIGRKKIIFGVIANTEFASR
jgi:hypothetical protein